MTGRELEEAGKFLKAMMETERAYRKDVHAKLAKTREGMEPAARARVEERMAEIAKKYAWMDEE